MLIDGKQLGRVQVIFAMVNVTQFNFFIFRDVRPLAFTVADNFLRYSSFIRRVINAHVKFICFRARYEGAGLGLFDTGLLVLKRKRKISFDQIIGFVFFT